MGKQTKLASTQQLQGIELLRIVAMNMIIVIHILGKGGLFTAASDSIPLKVVAAFMRASVVPAVNCYVLITGYFLCDKTFKSSRITKNVMITVEYSAMLTCAIIILGGGISRKDLVVTLIPVPLQDTYWFVTQYISLLLLSPILNRLIKGLTKQQLGSAVVILFVVFSLLPSIFFLKSNVYSTGTDICWFSTLYLTAACIKKCENDIFLKSRIVGSSIKILLASTIITALGYLIASSISKRITGRADSFGDIVYNYNAPLVYLCSVSLFSVFYKVQIMNNTISKLILMVGKHTFGIYLFHNHFLFREIIWDCVHPSDWAERGVVYVLTCVVITTLGIFITGLFVDIIRSRIEYLGLRVLPKNNSIMALIERIDSYVNLQ